MITRQDVAARLTDYLHHRLTLEELVEWAEQAMMEGEFEESNFEALRDTISRLGLADVREFGLAWEDCKEFLSRLGYQVRIEVSEVV
ncbi:MAG: hypothetical protein HYY65_11265 [Candidatus Tectomicrobia bacterium]|uniref:Uncharacterized protein n=1 Tax=Tectimicrobiota bacterium TaxID=2528274 RepID=A0A932M1L7_UNCTE|nr:hypothetical protein [Candidatus Tectomicrobia bacterium]